LLFYFLYTKNKPENGDSYIVQTGDFIFTAI